MARTSHEPKAAKNAERVFMKITSLIVGYDGIREADHPVGAGTRNRGRKRCWTSTGAPASGATAGVKVGDLCLDITNDNVYRRNRTTSASASWTLVAVSGS